ncbi:uncharacterized protein LOC131928015 [Physella acuta]|uniref:uncharacterized protein LOC131928015 n=1 Tax=Physella acuta TaxID=109671 RepID=UPI0027DDDBD9|nr:uncharacterized protein LOC131928015 [Physella acuta]XP_059139889.1 uncharacterized protein LOC131928015 [Physella acuta]XP_059139890.1 uncharacterized protein LOC131928015 [Physella acuta]
MAKVDESYEVTGKVSPPKLPMENMKISNWNSISSTFLESVFSETAIEGTKMNISSSLCALSSPASVILSSNGLSHSVVSLPYYFCNFCDHSTDNKATLLRHVTEKHMFKCQMCDFISFTRSGLVQHQLYKHVDAEEMQPILITKTVQLNVSQLHRSLPNFVASSEVHSCHLLTSPEENSPTVGQNLFGTPLAPASHPVIKNESPDTSTVDISGKDNGSCTNSHDVVRAASSAVGDSNGEKSLRRDKVWHHLFSDGKIAAQMPHFLDDSDASVTSSSNLQSSPSPKSQEGKTLYNNSMSKDCGQVPSFLTEPIVSQPGNGSPSRLKTIVNSDTLKSNSESFVYNIDSNVTKKKSQSLPTNISKTMSAYPTLQSALSEGKGKDLDRSLSPNLSSLSVERLQKQFEDAVSNSPGFIFSQARNTFHHTQDGSSNDLQHSVKNSKSLFDDPNSLLLCNPAPNKRDKNIDNFLMNAEDPLGMDNYSQMGLTKERSSTNNSQCENKEKLNKTENFDLLRNLLVQKPKDVVSNHRSSGLSSPCTVQTSESPSTVNHHRSPRTRASDMSLKELLTGDLPKSARDAQDRLESTFTRSQNMDIFLVCGYCNFESHNKAQFDTHVKMCTNRNQTGGSGHKIFESFQPNPLVKIKSEISDDDCRDFDNSTQNKSDSMDFKQRPVLTEQSRMARLSSPRTDSDRGLDSQTMLSVDRKRNHSPSKDDETYESCSSESDHCSESENKHPSIKRSRKCCPAVEYDGCLPLKCQDPLSKQPRFNVTCLSCSYSTTDRLDMRQHLMLSHPMDVPYAKASFEPGTKALLYFCKGVNSQCTFFSIEGAEIFEHIKLCYYGYLDQFVSTRTSECSTNYSQVLGSLGIAAKKLDPAPTTYYCLRCNFSKSHLDGILGIAHHVKTNHPDTVAGVLTVNRSLAEKTRVQMLCLVCNSCVTVKQWAAHSCRKASKKTVSDVSTFKQSTHPLNSTMSDQREHGQEKSSILCELMAAEKGQLDNLMPGHTLQSNNPLSRDSEEEAAEQKPLYTYNEGVCIKQEVEDSEEYNEISESSSGSKTPVTCVESVQLGLSHRKIDDSENLSNEAGKTPMRPSVLENLLTSPKEADFNLKSYSLLQNLLKSSSSELKAEPLCNSKAIFSRKQEKLSCQAPCPQLIVGSLSQSVMVKKNTPKVNNDKYTPHTTTVHHRGSASRAVAAHSLFPYTAPSATAGSPNRAPSQASPPLIPQPPALPVIPPLSPQPADEAQQENIHSPFSNLLRGLLSKVNSKNNAPE